MDDAQAVQLASRGDANAFMTLVRRYRAPLIAFIHGRTRARDEAEDLAQDVFCKAWQQLPRLREPAAFSRWLFRIASHTIITASRKRRPAMLANGDVEVAVPPASANSSVDVHAAVAELPEAQRIVVSLRHFTGMPTDEIAAVLGIEPGTVRSRLSRAYVVLRKGLARRMEV